MCIKHRKAHDRLNEVACLSCFEAVVVFCCQFAAPTSVRKVVLTVFFVVFVAYKNLLQWVVKFGARLCQSSAILVHSWDISFTILAHFTPPEASRGGYVGGDWGRGVYVEGFAAVISLFCGDVGPLGCFFSAV